MSESLHITMPTTGWTREFETRDALQAYNKSIEAAIGLLQDWGANVSDSRNRKYAKYPCPPIPGQISKTEPPQ